jgi:hypothetical protein
MQTVATRKLDNLTMMRVVTVWTIRLLRWLIMAMIVLHAIAPATPELAPNLRLLPRESSDARPTDTWRPPAERPPPTDPERGEVRQPNR